MSVGVVRTDADEPDGRGDLPVQERVLVVRAVVGDLDHLGPLDAGGTEAPLRGLPQVAEVQPGHARDAARARLGPERQARVVAGGPRPGPGPDHPPPERPERAGGRVVRAPDVDTGSPEGPDDGLVGGATGGADERGRHAVGHGVDGTDVVAVEMGEHEQVDVVDAEQVQTRVEPVGVVSRVDERDPVPGDSGCRRSPSDEHRVPLADVARGRRPVPRHARAHHEPGHGDDHDTDHRDDPGEQEQSEADRPRYDDGDRDAHADGGGGDHPAGPGGPRGRGPRQGSGPLRDGTDRARRHPGDGREDRRGGGPHRGEEARAETHDGDDRCERLGQEVRRHRVGGERRGERDRHRPARELRGDRHREGSGERRPHPTGEQRGERRPEHHDPAGRQHREHEGDRPRVPGVDDEHAHHGECDERDPAHRSAGQVDPERQHRHHRRAHDGGVGPDEHDESEQEHHGDPGPHVPRQPDGPTEHHHEPDDHGAVRSGHRGEVRQRRGLHRRLGRRVQTAPVADRETTEESAAGFGECLGDVDERLPRTVRAGEEAGGRLGPRGAAQEDRGRRRAAGRIRLERGRRPEPGTGGETCGADVRIAGRDHPDRYPQVGVRVDADECPDHRPLARSQVTVEDDVDGHRSRFQVVECLRVPAAVTDQHRDRQQRTERGRGQHRTGGHDDAPAPHRRRARSLKGPRPTEHDPRDDPDGHPDHQQPDRGVRGSDEQDPDEPGHRHRPGDPQVGHPRRDVHRHGRQTRTRSRSSANRPSPMPLTSSRSSTAENRPCS